MVHPLNIHMEATLTFQMAQEPHPVWREYFGSQCFSGFIARTSVVGCIKEWEILLRGWIQASLEQVLVRHHLNASRVGGWSDTRYPLVVFSLDLTFSFLLSVNHDCLWTWNMLRMFCLFLFFFQSDLTLAEFLSLVITTLPYLSLCNYCHIIWSIFIQS